MMRLPTAVMKLSRHGRASSRHPARHGKEAALASNEMVWVGSIDDEMWEHDG